MQTERRGAMRLLHDDDNEDPMSGLANLFDVSMVFAVALMVAMVSFMKMSEMLTQNDVTIVKNPGKRNMEIIKKKGKKIEKYKASEVTAQGDGAGRKIGTAYELENGEIIYIPE
jgi:hypothetical protein